MDPNANKSINRKNPRATAGILSALTFAWTFDLFRRGFRRELKISDLCEPLPEHTAHLLGNKFEELWNKELEAHKQNPKRKASLIRVIFKAYGGKIVFLIAATYLSEFVFKLAQPLLLGQMLQHFTPNSTVTYEEAKLYAGGVVLCILGNLITLPPCILASSHLGVKVRVATCSLIYRKSLRLSKEATSKIGAGHLVNILSNDASRFDFALVYLPDVFLGPLITGVVAYVIWVEAGLLALIGVAALLLLVPLQAVLAKKTATLRYKIAVKTDNRIRLMSEIIAGIQVIKMYAWEKSFAKLVGLARKKEVDIIREKSFTVGILNTASAFSTKLALYASLLAYASYGHAIRANVVFLMVLCYTILEDNLMCYFPMAISHAAESFVSIRRMEAFLLQEEATEAIVQRQAASASKGEVQTTDLCAKWSSEKNDNTLDHLNIRIQPGSLVAVIGAVGSGKSSFLQLILRELPVTSGTIEIGGSVSYASQEAWLFGGTVCQNILFGLPMDRDKYQRVVRVCALETDLKQLPQGDKTVIGDRGVCLSGGQRARINLARAAYRDADIYLLDDPLSAVDSHVSRQLFDECICDYLSGKTVVLATHHVQRLTNVGHVIKLDRGKVVAEGSFKELCDTGVDLESTEESAPARKLEAEECVKRKSLLDVSSTEDISKDSEMRSSGKVGRAVYVAYLKAVKNFFLVVCVILSFILVIVATSGSDYWLSFWVNNEEYVFPEQEYASVPLLGDLNRSTCITIYGTLIGTLVALAVIRTLTYFWMCMRASENLHDTMFRTVSQATMNFFNTTPAGQILNRFSRDVGIIDEVLPKTLEDCARVTLQVLGSLVIIFIVNWYLMVPFLAVMLVLYTLRQCFVTTSRSIKRIESITRSPIYTHVNASLQGLTTIRAMRTQSRLHQEFDHKLDANTSAFYYILGTNRAFAYYLDLTCCLYISVVTFSFLILDNEFLGGDVGLAITQSMGLTFLFQWCIRQSAEVENQMTSVERVCEFGKVELENKNLEPTSERKLYGWPSRGVVQFSDVSLFYDKTGPAVLKNISFDIRAGEKIGVVGRTGAGKSSLVAALFRLQKIEGSITIDGIDTSTIGLQDLRSRISIIPQDPVIFSGPMRFNLDPFEEFKDSDLWSVLEEVELKSIVQDSPLGLHINLSEGGVNLSVGQRQLVCLARAILRNSTVLVLDEATANVDAETDDFIQAAIRKRFAHCTVITIAHRLHTIMDSDRVLVMDNGRVAEFGPPQVLLLDPKGHFTHLVGLAGAPTSVTISEKSDKP